MRRELKARRVNAIDAKDGIDEDEAYDIAKMYFEMYLGVCGGPARPIRHGRFWTSGGVVGLVDDPLPAPIKVDARTGGVQGPHGPAYASFAEFGRAWLAGW